MNADISTAFPGSPLTELVTVPIDLRHVARMLGAIHDCETGRYEIPFGPKRDILKATIALSTEEQRAA